MALRSPFWSANDRLQRAAENNRAMGQGEPNAVAVKLLQQALTRHGFGVLKDDGIFGPKTALAVRGVQNRFNMDRDQGVAGRQVLGILDILLQNGQLGSELGQTDTALASHKMFVAVLALTAFRTSFNTGTPSPLTVDALRAHFRLTVGVPTIGVTRQVTVADIDAILNRYGQLLGLFSASATTFRTAVPFNGINTAAEAPVGGPITFGPGFTNVDSHFGDRIGPNSRAAILLHEAVHVFDAESGIDGDTHISEFDPAYDTQRAERALHNPSSFAGFAAHIHNNGDPRPRFGLGPGARGL